MIDYYKKPGCCFDCWKSAPGCLCFECKCKKCSWYISPELSGEFDSKGKPKGSCKIKWS